MNKFPDVEKQFKIVLAIWIVCALVSLSVVVGIIWVACHFIAKYW